MHNNYYFLRQLALELERVLKGAVVSECFSQSKDELVMRFETHAAAFFIKASLLPSFCCLAFPQRFERAKKNSVDLFGSLIGRRLLSTTQFNNERSFMLLFEGGYHLLFKMHGNRANILLCEGDHVVDLFKNSIAADKVLDVNLLHRTVDWSYETFITNQQKPEPVYFTFGKLVWQYLEAAGFALKSPAQQWQAIQDTVKILEKPRYYITEVNHTPTLSLLPMGVVQKELTTAIDAVNDFYNVFTQTIGFRKERSDALAHVKAKLQNSQHYIEKTAQKLAELQRDNNYRVWADVLMANLHTIPARSEKIVLQNFYSDNQWIEIKLKRDQSPQKNAENYYRKSKNQQIEETRLRQAVDSKEKEIAALQEIIKKLDDTTDFKSLRTLTAAIGLKKEQEKQPELLPYHEAECNGYKIWIGRNAMSNDVLTLKYTYKEDLWLHAKDVAGSHVVIKFQAGKVFPKDVIERAAQLAAYYSKRKNETLCPVIVTPKKFVRKRKGDTAGVVVVEREEVILVEPKK